MVMATKGGIPQGSNPQQKAQQSSAALLESIRARLGMQSQSNIVQMPQKAQSNEAEQNEHASDTENERRALMATYNNLKKNQPTAETAEEEYDFAEESYEEESEYDFEQEEASEESEEYQEEESNWETDFEQEEAQSDTSAQAQENEARFAQLCQEACNAFANEISTVAQQYMQQQMRLILESAYSEINAQVASHAQEATYEVAQNWFSENQEVVAEITQMTAQKAVAQSALKAQEEAAHKQARALQQQKAQIAEARKRVAGEK